jgi:hypothetical protein
MKRKKPLPTEWKVSWVENESMQERTFVSFSRLRSETLKINRRGGRNIQVRIAKMG